MTCAFSKHRVLQPRRQQAKPGASAPVREVKKKKKKKKAAKPRARKYAKGTRDSDLIGDLFSDLDSSMRFTPPPPSQRGAAIHLKGNAPRPAQDTDSMPVAMADADGVYTSGGIGRLLAAAKQRKITNARRAKEAAARKKIDDAAAAVAETERLKVEGQERTASNQAAAASRAQHQAQRPPPGSLDAAALAENVEEQEDEMEGMEAMYPDDYEAIDGTSFRLAICDSAVRLTVKLPAGYPSACPPEAQVSFESAALSLYEIDPELQFLLEDMWIERDGSVLLFEWVEDIKEKIQDYLDSNTE